MPLILLFSPWTWLTWVAIISIWMLHTFILSTIPIAVPLEWNVFFMFVVAFLFANFPPSEGYGVGDMNPALLAIVVCVALAPIILGALRPQYVSFLVGMKQYAGNWASGTFSFRDKSMEDRINERIVKAADNQIDQLDPLFGMEISEIFIQKAVAFRMMHPMGRMHISALMRHTDGLDDRIQREGEFVSNVLTGWNFGDGHCLDERLIEALQERCQYEPGDVVVAWTESQPAFSKKVQYRVIDAALGTVEKGWYHNDDAANEQPWLPNGPIPHTVTWTLPGVRGTGRRLSRQRRPRAELGRRQARDIVTSAIVVGSGPNGLAAAAQLARAGLDVTVLEASDTIGGGTRSSEMIVPGLVHDQCSAFHPIAAGSPFLTGLDLASDGLTWLQPEVDCAHPLDDGSAGVLYRSIERTADRMGRDGQRWRRVFAPTVSRFDDLFADASQPILRVPRHPLTLARFGAAACCRRPRWLDSGGRRRSGRSGQASRRMPTIASTVR